MRKLFFWIVVMSVFCAIGYVWAEGPHKYVGVKKCAMCHKSESKGNQYGQWLASAHAKAYERLASPEALESAKKKGIAGNPQEAPQCVKCHVTGYGEDTSLFAESFVKTDGVQCETCHGAGSDYLSLSVMKDRAKAIAAGLIIPTKELCVKCHNPESPNYKEFNYDEYVKRIAHPRPKE
ncbi:MAG: cytochrome c family protein [Candidatus Omnitrophota bacterium]|nr:cytochrome c family protein [Candidatus Omnitrophota bacterium]